MAIQQRDCHICTPCRGRFGAEEAPEYAVSAPSQFPEVVGAASAKAPVAGICSSTAVAYRSSRKSEVGLCRVT
jgi:hypothetical protein